MKEIMIASSNAHKIEEFRQMLEPLGYKIMSCLDLDNPFEVEETGATFEENAMLKARAYHEYLHIPVMADDSGLAVDALDGAPGVYSARYMGHDTSYEIKNNAIIAKVEGKSRGAQFVCVIAYIDEEGYEHSFKGVVEGEIAHEIIGKHGFGYDPIFFYPPYGTTLANVTQGMKNAVSHRGKALNACVHFLEGSE